MSLLFVLFIIWILLSIFFKSIKLMFSLIGFIICGIAFMASVFTGILFFVLFIGIIIKLIAD